MARQKEYDRQEVLDKAVHLFWQKGYKASSMSDIVQATGLNTASMYKEFGDKDGLFEASLEYYRENILSVRIQLLVDHQNLAGVEAFLQSVIDGATAKQYRGCLMMNHLAQKHSISPRAAKLIGDFCATMEGHLETALRNAQAAGEIAAHKDPAVLASFIMCCVHGLVLYGRYPNRKSQIPKLTVIFSDVLRA